MKYIKKLFGYALFLAILLLIGTLKYDLGKVCLTMGKIEKVISTNILLISIILIFFAFSTLRALINSIKEIISRNAEREDFEEQKKITEMILLHRNCEISNKYEMIRDAIFINANNSNNIFKYKKINSILFIFIIKNNIVNYIENNNIIEAVKLADIILNEFPKHVNLIEEELLLLEEKVLLNFDPKKTKYNISKEFIQKFLSIRVLKSDDKKILETYNKEYPGNIDIVSKLLVSNKKPLLLLKECFTANPNRNISNLLRNEEKSLGNAELITKNTSDDNLEKLWLICYVATESNLITKATEMLIKITEIDYSGAIEFFVKNHAKFSNNIELLEKLQCEK